MKRGGGWAARSKGTSAIQRASNCFIGELPLGSCLSTIGRDDLHAGPDFDKASAAIGFSEYIASYSWVDAQTPTIIIPGEPRCLV
jgi:hypothetical protein